jgi:hypothetical protein
VDPEGKSLPAINSFKKENGFRIYKRGKGDGITAAPIARFIGLNNISVLISRRVVYINIIEYFLYYKKEYYSNIYLKNKGNFLLKNNQTYR